MIGVVSPNLIRVRQTSVIMNCKIVYDVVYVGKNVRSIKRNDKITETDLDELTEIGFQIEQAKD